MSKVTATTLSISQLIKQLKPGEPITGSKVTVSTPIIDPNHPTVVALRPGGIEDPKIK